VSESSLSDFIVHITSILYIYVSYSTYPSDSVVYADGRAAALVQWPNCILLSLLELGPGASSWGGIGYLTLHNHLPRDYTTITTDTRDRTYVDISRVLDATAVSSDYRVVEDRRRINATRYNEPSLQSSPDPHPTCISVSYFHPRMDNLLIMSPLACSIPTRRWIISVNLHSFINRFILFQLIRKLLISCTPIPSNAGSSLILE
jgi:hypothetical protein